MTFAAEKQRSFVGVLAGLGLILVGMAVMRSHLLFAAPLIVFGGVWLSGKAFTRLIRIWAIEQQLLGDARERFRQHYGRASLPRQVFWLLFAVAESDGRPEAEERELVRRFLLERFVDPISAADLLEWEAQRAPPEQVGAIALNLRRVLSRAECETLFYWCCMVAFVDRSFRANEHSILQEVARNLGIDGHHARRLFHHAKARFVGARGGGARATPRNERRRALAILGLDAGASKEEVRRRHRELVKKFHPDAHNHLGSVAAEEAAKRFREVQSAYELLTAARG